MCDLPPVQHSLPRLKVGNTATATSVFGSPFYNSAHVEVQTGMAVIEHDFGGGLTVKNSSLYADYTRGYQNVYPGGTGGGPGGGPSANGLVPV